MRPSLLNSVVLCLAFGSAAQAQLTWNNTPVTVTFDASVPGVAEGPFAGAGFQSTPATGQLDADAWAVTGLSDGALNFGEAGTTGDYARGLNDGGTATGGLFAFEVGGASDVALGFQATADDLTPGALTLRVLNGTGSVLTDLAVAYRVHTYNDQGRSSSLNFAYSIDNAVFIPVAALDFTSPETAQPTPLWETLDRSTVLTGLGLADGAFLYLRWTTDDVGGGGSRDELAIDNIALDVPEPAFVGLLTAGCLGLFALVRRRLA